MKYIHITLTFLFASAVLLSSCEEDNPFEDNVGKGEHIGEFQLQTPGNFSEVTVNDAQADSEIEITWEAAPAGLNGDVSYQFMLDQKGNDFTSPLLSIPSDGEGLENKITVTYGQLIDAVENAGASEFIWTVEASTSTSLGTNQKRAENNFEIVINVAPDGVSAFDYVVPELNQKVVLNTSLNPDSLLVFDWEDAQSASGGAVSFKVQFDYMGGDFSNPVFAFKSDNDGADSELSITHQTLVDSLGTTEFEDGLEWRVVGSVGEFTYSPGTRYLRFLLAGDCGNFCTIGIIGNATPGDWATDTDMRLSDPENDKFSWTVTTYLNVGEMKFRASDDWANNWGASDFPSGVATQDGPNIPISSAGYYTINFNDKTGEYNITELAATEYTTIGMIGSGTPGGWDSDTDLTQDPGDVHVWTGTITLTDGEAKFRANDAWDTNWGGSGAPSGYGTFNGPNIPVSAGTYNVWFHDVTGEYMIMNETTVYTSVGIIGDATPNGWDSDTDLIQNPANPYKYSGIVTITDGEAKFRADDDWANNWGASDFPEGLGFKNGPNVPVTAGTYVVSFNSGTGEYKFLK